jgi:8-oxo-dGTP pyrophosphatase MutT (NUDIX family)
VPTLEQIRDTMAAYEAELEATQDRGQAAVAMILRDLGAGPEVLFIERALRKGDPWSGHMALPGGRVDPEDQDARATAERETEEEVGLSLAPAAYLGRLDDIEGGARVLSKSLLVSAHVYHLEDPGALAPNYEVREAFWFPVAELLDSTRHVDYLHPAMRDVRYPGILVGIPERQVVWGLTYRILEGFFSVLGRPLPERWGELGQHFKKLPKRSVQRPA